ncbi:MULTISPECIES: monovalent cation:proton antiporter-2 (CPA2) family protein [unclassified Oleiphilus]|nr:MULTISPECIES: monovalent cation:proton antiporter-2 (CPA2) family protein [unclassified Oleiphilus]KZY62013.1 potassium transporter [Oleiphilus sp. HI0066]KZY69726.1 potassium transporter [Oleiphilus sp. HI0067]MCH2158449.1 monovalent cation:proton antiporter-2 (CPA2) family protein [Oleiphilaceae bacterium]
MTAYFIQASIYLLAAVIAVPIAKRLGLGSVLGYLIAGVVIGPIAGLVGQETQTIQHFAEFGVVMMLFLVGLELEPKMLWNMKTKLLGLGGLQVGLSTLCIALIASLFIDQWTYALAIGLIFSLSSTAIVLQTFNEKGLNKSEGGKSAFSVLLFQDIAVIPMLALIPLLAISALSGSPTVAEDAHHGYSLVDGLSSWAYAIVVLSAIAIVVVGGHFASRPLFRFVAASGLREIFTASALLLVIGIAAIMSLVGLSPALGTFLAGVVLANSEFKHELESTVEPFKGLLLGLFFITVGAGIDFGLFSSMWLTVLAATAALMLVKFGILYVLATIFRIKNSDRWLLSLSLAQAGEFGFVLLSFSVQNSGLPDDISKLLALVIAISMFLTPLLFIAFDKIILPRFELNTNASQEEDAIEDSAPVVIAGIGRFGQVINRLLTSNGIPTVVLDRSVDQINLVRNIGIKSYYGDATRHDLLHTAGIEQASLFVVAIDESELAIELVNHVSHTYPHIKILARAYDRRDGYALRQAGAHHVVFESFYSALELGGQAMQEIGFHPFHVEQLKQNYIDTEQKHDSSLYDMWQKAQGDSTMMQHYRLLFIKLEELLKESMKSGREDKHDSSHQSWAPPPKNYLKELRED